MSAARERTRNDLISGAIAAAVDWRKANLLPDDHPVECFPPGWMYGCLTSRDVEWLSREHAVEIRPPQDDLSWRLRDDPA